MKSTLILIPFFLTLFLLTQAEFRYKICAEPRHKDVCTQLERAEKIQCRIVDNAATCLTKISSGEIDFGSVPAETAFIAAPLVPNVAHIAMLFPETRGDAYDYETVVVSTKPIEKFSDLKGMSYCHPGFDATNIPPLLLKEFEMKILKEVPYKCDDTETVSEKYLNTLNGFFGESCRPGRWSQNDEFNTQLQAKYQNLIKLCPKINSSSNPIETATHCISKVENSVVLTTIKTVNDVINNSPDIHYVCKNGTSSQTPCIWSKQPHKLIVRNMGVPILSREIKEWLSEHVNNKQDQNEGSLNWDAEDIQRISEILGVTDGNLQMKLDFSKIDNETLKAFVKALRDVPTPKDSQVCNQDVMKWCTTSEKEQSKCEWLSQAALNYGIEPVLQCVKKSSEIKCIEAIKTSVADLRTIPADYGYFSKRQGLAAIAFPETVSESPIKTLLIVKGNNITSLTDLEGKKGCFPSYGGVAWVSFLSAIRGIIVPNNTCDYGKSLSDTLGDSCMPGASENSKITRNSINQYKMCKLCKSCDPKESANLNLDALECFERDGDFAIIVYEENLKFPNNAWVMCRNGTVSKLDGFSVDEDCHLSVLTTSEVVTRRNDTKNKDIQLALVEYDEWFAANTRSAFHLFNTFDGEKDLLFKDSTPGLDLLTSDKKLIKNYVNMFEHIDTCASGSGGGTTTPISIDKNNKGTIAFLTTIILIIPFVLNLIL